MKQAWLLALAMLSGCWFVEPTDWHPEDVESGRYELKVITRTDTCSPRRGAGDIGELDVDVSSGVISTQGVITTDSYLSFYSYDLSADDGYEITSGRGLLLGKDCGAEATYLTHHELTAATGGGFVVRQRTDWTVTRPCLDAVNSEVPRQSCRVEQDYRYELLWSYEETCWDDEECGW